MRSPDQHARLVLLILAVAFGATAVIASISRSLIPRDVDATVQRVEVRHEKHPGVDDVWIVHLDDDAVHVDAAIAQRLERGMALRKDAWDTTLTAGGENVSLHLSREARGMLWVMPLAVLSAAALSRGWRRRRR